MVYRLPPLNALRAFEAVARHGSVKHAAAELFVTPAAVSQQIRQLEEHLGVQLFHRLTRSLELTDAARAALPKLREGFEALAAAVERTRSHAGRQTLTVWAPPTFASRWLVPRLARFTASHPQVDLRVSTSLQTIDDRAQGAATLPPVELGGDESEVAIRFGTGQYPGYRTEKVSAVAWVPVCSPRLLTGERALRGPQDLRFHTLIHDETVRDMLERPSWEAWLKLAGVTDVDPTRGPRFTDAALALQAAADGLGVVLGLHPLIAEDVSSGRLAVPFRLSLPSGFAYYLVCPEAIAERPAVAGFRAWLMDEVRRDEQVAAPARAKRRSASAR